MRFSLKAPSLLKWKNLTGLRCHLDFLGHHDGSLSSDSQTVLCGGITWGGCQRCGFRAQQDKHSGFSGGSAVKNLPAMQEFSVGSVPGWGESPEGGNGNHSSILAWRIPWQRSLGVGGGCSPWDRKRIRCDLATKQHQGKDSDLAGDGRAQESVVFSKHCRWLWCKYSEAPSFLRSYLWSTRTVPKTLGHVSRVWD